MNITWKTDTDDLFKQCLKLSLMAHVSIVLIWGLKSFILPSRSIIVPNAIRVDLVGLPDKPTPVKKKAKPKPKAKAPEKPKPKPKKKDTTQSDQQKALQKLNQLAALEKLKNQKKAQQKPEDNSTTEEVKPETPQYKGNLVLSGNSFTGLSGIEAQSYWSDAKAHLQNYWTLPEYLIEAGLRAKAMVMIDESGRVVRAEIYESSGNQAFDNETLAAVEAASPFPVPPERIRDTITSNMMIFSFPE